MPCLVPFNAALAEYEPPAPWQEIIERVRQRSARIVLFGAPGIGKSALANALAFQFTQVRPVRLHVHNISMLPERAATQSSRVTCDCIWDKQS